MPTGAREARQADAPAIADVQLRAWRELFAALLPETTLSALDVHDLAAQWRELLSAPPTSRHRVLVATDEAGAVVGYAPIGPDDAPDADSATGQLFDLVIDPDRLRLGHGSRLMTASIDTLRESGCTAATIWIPVSDAARRRFLESAGWGPDGAFRDLEIDGTLLRQIRLVTDCSIEG